VVYPGSGDSQPTLGRRIPKTVAATSHSSGERGPLSSAGPLPELANPVTTRGNVGDETGAARSPTFPTGNAPPCPLASSGVGQLRDHSGPRSRSNGRPRVRVPRRGWSVLPCWSDPELANSGTRRGHAAVGTAGALSVSPPRMVRPRSLALSGVGQLRDRAGPRSSWNTRCRVPLLRRRWSVVIFWPIPELANSGTSRGHAAVGPRGAGSFSSAADGPSSFTGPFRSWPTPGPVGATQQLERPAQGWPPPPRMVRRRSLARSGVGQLRDQAGPRSRWNGRPRVRVPPVDGPSSFTGPFRSWASPGPIGAAR